MTRKQIKKIRTRNRYSKLCEKQTQLKSACVYVNIHKVWAVCKGKAYDDGTFQFLHNGQPGMSSPFQSIVEREGVIDRRFLKREAIRLNLEKLKIEHPQVTRSPKPYIFANLININPCDEVLLGGNLPIVEPEA